MPLMKKLIPIFFLTFVLSIKTEGQTIPIKSVPVIEGSQFLLFPSKNLSMGGVSIAMEDPWLDSFSNPAKKPEDVNIFFAPTAYSITNNWGSGNTAPLSAYWGSQKMFGTFSLAIQQLKSNKMNNELSSQNRKNQYLFLSLGKLLKNTRSSVGFNIALYDLDAVHSVDLLYANASKIEQSGKIFSIRGGLFTKWPEDRTLDMIILFQKVRMEHHVTSSIWVGPEPLSSFSSPTHLVDSTEINKDWSNTYGFNCRYRQLLGETGWKIGTTLTINRKTHPKIPNYSIMNIPRDPGDSWAFNLGAGLARLSEQGRVGFDIIYEPIWSHTWANAIEKIWAPDDRAILAGEKTVDNKFVFSNSIIRFGISNEKEKSGFQLGLQMRNISYRLKQHNRIEDVRRTQRENWTEWTITGGLDFKFQDFNLHYAIMLNTGTGLPGITTSPWGNRMENLGFDAGAKGDFIIAPSGDLALEDCHVWTHQVTLVIPIINN